MVETNDTCKRVPSHDLLYRSRIIGSIVHDDHLEVIQSRLDRESIKAAPQRLRSITCRDDDRNRWRPIPQVL